MSIKNRLRRLEQATEGERAVLACPECGEEFTLYGDPALELICLDWLRATGEKNRGRQIDPAVIKMTEHEHEAYDFIDKATGEWWLKDLLGARRWEAADEH